MKTYYILEKLLYKVEAEDEEDAWEHYYERSDVADMSKRIYKRKPKI